MLTSMSSFPALEVLSSSLRDIVVGMRIRLTDEQFVIGRAIENPLRLAAGSIARHHCQLMHEQGQWRLRDNGSTNGTFFLGRRLMAPVALAHGDVFDVAGHVCLRLLLHEPAPDAREPTMEQSLIEDPTDDQRWSVYADWLQEHGAPLGERLAHRRPEDDLRWLGPLAREAVQGELEVSWNKGVPARAVLRHFTNESNSIERSLRTLVVHPLFRFLRSLELDRSAFHRDEGWDSWTDRILELLEGSLPMLETLKIGPAAPAVPSQRVIQLLGARRQRNPRFITTPERLHREWSPATLQRGTVVHALPRGVTFHVGPKGSDLEIGPDCPSFGLILHADRWRLTVDLNSKSEVKVNGVPVRSACLRPLDEIEPVDGVRLQFNA